MSYQLDNILESINYKLGRGQREAISDELFQLNNLFLAQEQNIEDLQRNLSLMETRFKRVLRDIDDEDEE